MRIYFLLVSVMSLSISAHAGDWAKYNSQNFTLYTDQREARAVALIEDLEAFRIIAMRQLGLPVAQSENQNLAIVSFGSNREFRLLTQDRNIAGFYINTNEGPRMIMGSGRREFLSAQEILFHEYVHHLTFEHSSGFTYPRWYLEGIASVFGTASIDKNSIVLGGRSTIASGVLDYYGPLRLRDLLRNSRLGDTSDLLESRFYASAWLMTHYLQIHALVNDRELGMKNREYLSRYHRGEDPVAAFEEVFGTTLSDFEQVLSNYSKQRGMAVINWPRPELDLNVTKTYIGETEKNYILADVLFASGKEELALSYLEELTSGEDYFAEASSLRAVMLNHTESNSEIASELALESIRGGQDSSSVFGNLAHFELDNYRRVVSSGNVAEAPQLIERAESFAREGVKLNPQNFNALWYLSSVLLAKNEHDEALEILDQAWSVFPSHQGVRIEIVKILLSQGDLDGATPIVRSLIGASHEAELGKKLAELLAQMESGAVDPSFLDDN